MHHSNFWCNLFSEIYIWFIISLLPTPVYHYSSGTQSFFEKNNHNYIKFWDCPSNTKWFHYSIVNKETLSQTSFSLYLHNQWTDFHKLSCAGKSICICVGCTKVTTNDWDIRPSVAVKALSANISWIAKWIHTIELALSSAHQSVYNDS